MRVWTQRRREQGSSGIQMAAVTLPLLMLIMLLVALGRAGKAEITVRAVADDAARAASISRDAGRAQTAAAEAAAAGFAQQGLTCLSQSANISTAGFTVPVGQPATVTATVTCAVSASDLGVPLGGGTKTFTAHSSSPIDTYRMRQ